MVSSIGKVKKLVVTFLAFSYFTMVVGATVHRHYCMGELVGISLFDFKDDDCLKCGMDKHSKESDGCCIDVSVSVKSGDTHDYLQATYDINNLFFNLNLAPQWNLKTDWPTEDPKNFYPTHSPPGRRPSRYILFGNWRI